MTMPFYYMNEKEVSKLFGIGRSTLRRMVARKEVPAPYRLGARRIGWRSNEVKEALLGFERMENAYQAELPRHKRVDLNF